MESVSTSAPAKAEDLYPRSLEVVLKMLDSGAPWEVAAAITVRTTYNAERRLRMHYERGADQLQATLDRIRDTQLPVVVEGILDSLGRAEMQLPEAGSPERETLVAKLVDELREAAR